jgi:cytochrome bd-type quinol oxidase subunit 2
MPGRRAPRTKLFAALTLIGAACVAALFAHVGIDLAGDVVLAHDTYDGLDHRSRSDVFTVALTLANGALLRVVWLAFAEARTGRATQRPTLDDVCGSAPWRFAGAVVALTLPALMTMELFDIVADGRHLDEATDLLGGSAWLGLSMTIPIAALVGLAVRSIAKSVLGSHRALVTVFGLLLTLLARFCPRMSPRSVARSPRLRLRRRSILSRRSGKRGPPLRAA